MNFVLRTLTTVLCVTTLVFLTLRLVPGDPIDLMVGENASQANRALIMKQLRLDEPFLKQIIHYFYSLAHGDLGTSFTKNRSVSAMILECLPFTALLALSSALFANLVGIPSGVFAVYRRRKTFARVSFALSLLALSIPIFWLGPLLILAFSLRWPWLPVSSIEHSSAIVLPTLTLGLAMAAVVYRTTRASISEYLHSDFARTARAKGASEVRVFFRHLLPNAALPILTVSTLQFSHLLAGAVITETIFGWPGLGRLTYDAILARDYPTVQGTVLVTTLFYVLMNTTCDALATRFHPEGNRA